MKWIRQLLYERPNTLAFCSTIVLGFFPRAFNFDSISDAFQMEFHFLHALAPVHLSALLAIRIVLFISVENAHGAWPVLLEHTLSLNFDVVSPRKKIDRDVSKKC